MADNERHTCINMQECADAKKYPQKNGYQLKMCNMQESIQRKAAINNIQTRVAKVKAQGDIAEANRGVKGEQKLTSSSILTA